MFGPEAGEHLVRVAGAAPDTLFDLVERHGIDCEATRCGWIQPTFADADNTLAERRVEQWQRRGAPVSLLDREAACRLVGSPIYRGGWIDRRAGSVQPLSYSRGLARAAQGAGALVCANSRVVGARARRRALERHHRARPRGVGRATCCSRPTATPTGCGRDCARP